MGGELPDCVKSRIAATASTLALTFVVHSSLFRGVLRLLRSGLVHTFLSEGKLGDVAGGVRPDSRTGVMLSTKERKDVLGWIGGGETDLPRRSYRGTYKQ